MIRRYEKRKRKKKIAKTLKKKGSNPTLKELLSPINEKLKISYEERNIGFIDNSNINKYHLNCSKLHLNAKGSAILAKNFKLVTSI